MAKHKNQRVGVFIDAANMYHSSKNLYNARVNFKSLLKDAVAERVLIRAIAYVISSSSGEEETFFDALDKQGFELKVKDLQVFSSGNKKADWDVGLSIDAIKLADKLDTIILVTGDGDFQPLVVYLKENKGCQVEVVAFSQTTSTKLFEISDDYLDLSSDPKKYLIGYKNKRSREK